MKTIWITSAKDTCTESEFKCKEHYELEKLHSQDVFENNKYFYDLSDEKQVAEKAKIDKWLSPLDRKRKPNPYGWEEENLYDEKDLYTNIDG